METMDGGRPGPADVEYFTRVQAGGWSQTLGAFLRFLAPPAGARVLDVGTGPGLLARLTEGAGAQWAVGCDDSPPMIRRAAELSAGSRILAWTVADALDLPFRCGAFDAVAATNLLFLLRDPAAAIASLARVTRAWGVVGFVNPGEGMGVASASAFAERRGLEGFDRFSFVSYGRLAEANHRFSAAAWSALAEAAGLEDVRSQTAAGGLVVFTRGMRGE